MSFSVLLFCIGLAAFFCETKAYHGLLDTAGRINQNEVLYQQSKSDDGKVVSYEELIAALLQTPEYDIKINGLIIKKSEHDIDKIPGYKIKETDYSKAYEYDSNGNIVLVIYQSLP